jgi:hypothetical protein
MPINQQTEFTVVNTSETDAYDIGIEGSIGPYDISNPFGGVISRLPGKQSSPKEYSLVERTAATINLSFQCQLTKLLAKLSEELGGRVYSTTLTLSYKDRDGDMYLTPFVLEYVAGMGYPPQISLAEGISELP